MVPPLLTVNQYEKHRQKDRIITSFPGLPCADAEHIRDHVLASSGLLSKGKSVAPASKPYQPQASQEVTSSGRQPEKVCAGSRKICTDEACMLLQADGASPTHAYFRRQQRDCSAK